MKKYILAFLFFHSCNLLSDAPKEEPNNIVDMSTIDTSTKVQCGNGILENNEECEGFNLRGATCQTQKFDGGTLKCLECKLDASNCHSCGDGEVNSGEDCDTSIGQNTCMTEGYASGTLSCSSKCEFDVSQCKTKLCGNGKKEDTEDCEGAMLGGKTCLDLGFERGNVTCNSKCHFDTSDCEKCGDGKKNGSEECDGEDFGSKTCQSQAGQDFRGNLICDATCKISSSDCSIRFVKISSGFSHACALQSDGIVVCWGDDNNGKDNFPAIDQYMEIAAGGNHSCALNRSGKAICVGGIAFQQTSSPDTIFKSLGEFGVADHTCGMKPDQRAECWKEDEPVDSQGHGKLALPPMMQFLQITGGLHHTCGLKLDHTIQCWGNLSNEPFGSAKYEMISSGNDHLCALNSVGVMKCWGYNSNGQTDVPSQKVFKFINVGGNVSCGILKKGSTICWGADSFKQASPKNTFLFETISQGGIHGCGLTKEGLIHCWGQIAGTP